MPKILLVEDNEEHRTDLKKHLERRGFQVVTAADGTAGVKAAGVEHPDLVLMDMTMSEVDGFETTRLLKAEPRMAAVPVIGLATLSADGDRERALAAGCIGYHVKPVDVDALLAEVEGVLLANAEQKVPVAAKVAAQAAAEPTPTAKPKAPRRKKAAE